MMLSSCGVPGLPAPARLVLLPCMVLLLLLLLPCAGKEMKIMEPTPKATAATTAAPRVDGVEAHGALKGHIEAANLYGSPSVAGQFHYRPPVPLQTDSWWCLARTCRCFPILFLLLTTPLFVSLLGTAQHRARGVPIFARALRCGARGRLRVPCLPLPQCDSM